MHQCGSYVQPDFIALTSILKDNTKCLILFKIIIKFHDFEYNSQNKTLNCPYASLTPPRT